MHVIVLPTPSVIAALYALSACAGLSTLWMGAGWNYYTVYSKQAADDPSVDTR